MQAALASRGDGCVAVVQDFEPLRRLLRDAFERMGRRVLECGDPERAEALWRESEPDIDLLVCDISLPGYAVGLARSFRARRPGIRILFLTFYDGIPHEYTSGLLAGATILTKPFTLQQLRQALAAPAPESGEELSLPARTRTDISHNRTSPAGDAADAVAETA